MKSGELYGVAARGGQTRSPCPRCHVSLQDVATATLRPTQQGASHSAIDPIQLPSLAVTIMMIDAGEP